MKNIKGIEKIISLYSTWKPSDIAFIKSLKWSSRNLEMVSYCQLRSDANGWPDISKDFFEVSLTFSNVSGLKLEFISNELQQISGFDILDVSGKGLEQINFQIEDYENGLIEFYCEGISINEASKPFKVSFT